MAFVPGEVKTAHANYVGVDGQVAEVQGDGVWTVAPAGAVTFVPGADRLSMGVTMGAPATGIIVSAEFDADLRDGAGFVRALKISSDPFDIVAPEAVGGNVTLN